MRKLNSTTSAAIINHLKSILAENGIPETLISDNGLQYSSQEFAAFASSKAGIDHVTSSPLYPQSNGFVERSVQTVKNLLRKAEASWQDPYLQPRTKPVETNRENACFFLSSWQKLKPPPNECPISSLPLSKVV